MKILLLDGHSILNRAFYGMPPLTNSQGLHTNGIYGFLNILFKLLDEETPTHICVCFDLPKPTFRHKLYQEYKGTRKGMPDELREQVPVLKDVLRSMNIHIVEQEGYEADDLLGTLSRMAIKENFDVSIISGDRDLLQLATDTVLVRLPKTKPSGTIIEDYYAKDVMEQYGVDPLGFIQMKGLMGDTSDNIPGVPGIGEKTAAKIISTFGTIEEAYAHIDEIKPNKARENLKQYYEQAMLSLELATIKLDCPLNVVLEELTLDNLFNQESYAIFKQLEFKKLYPRFQQNDKDSNKLEIEIKHIQDLTEAEELFHEFQQLPSFAFQFYHNNGQVFGLGLSKKAQEVYCIPVAPFIPKEYLVEQLLQLLKSGARGCTFHLKEQLHVIDQETSIGSVADLCIMGYLLNPLKGSYEYDELAQEYLEQGIPGKTELLGKQELTAINFFSEETIKMIGYEVGVQLSLVTDLWKKLEQEHMVDLYWNIEYPTIYSLYRMEKYGILVEKESLKKYGDDLTGKIAELENRIHEYAGIKFNILSPKQLGEVLFERLCLLGGKKTKTGYSTNVEVLEKVKNQHPIVEAVLEYRQLTKLKSTYADGLAGYIHEDQRIHGRFHQTITATGRISSTEPNLQNIPIRMPLGRQIRKVFIPKEGYVFVDADYSQIELRVLAHLSQDENMIQAFLSGKDIHKATAAEVFGVPLDEVTELQRRNAKAVNFGIVYGISAFGLSQDLNISRKEAELFIARYFDTYKRVKLYLDTLVDQGKSQGVVRTAFNRLRPIPELSSSNFVQRGFGERIAMNSPIQGTAADLMKLATHRVNTRLDQEGLSSRLILQIHDELLIEAKIEEVELVKKIMEEEMSQVADFLVPLVVEVHVANNWYDAK